MLNEEQSSPPHFTCRVTISYCYLIRFCICLDARADPGPGHAPAGQPKAGVMPTPACPSADGGSPRIPKETGAGAVYCRMAC
ncbi:protein of unknown function [Rhodovastum atsumiense]|nr:protein of unknown function [Rhodovastum atsumiense]